MITNIGIQIYMLIFMYFQIVMESILSMHLLQVVQVMEEFILFIMINLGMLLKINHLEKVIFKCRQYKNAVSNTDQWLKIE